MPELTLPAVLTQAEAAGVLRALTQALRQGGGAAAASGAKSGTKSGTKSGIPGAPLAGAEAGVQAGPVVVDASALQAFDSSALAVLLACRREAQAAGHAFAVRALPERLRVLAALYGVQELLPN